MARRGKTQARRHAGNGGLPGWAWAVIGALIAVVLVLAVPRWLDSEDPGDGPQPDPDAQPAPVASGDGLVEPDDSAPEEPEYDFYTLLPGKEVRLSDAELAAQERAEAQQQAEAAATTDEQPLPQPVDTDSAVEPSQPATEPATVAATTAAEANAAIDDGSRYLLQAGAFQSAQQAEALKARIALLGLAAWVEPVTIDGKLIHRVRMGPYDSAGALADAKRKLANRGLPGMAIKVK